MTPILDQDGNEFYTGLQLPEGEPDNFVSAMPRMGDAVNIYSDADVQAIVNDPTRQAAADEFDDHWVIEGNQKKHNSCAGWGGANAFSKMRWRLGIRDGTVFSGSYAYSWCNRNQDKGAVLDEVMNELMAHGLVAASKCDANTIYRTSTKQFDAEAQQHEGLALYSIKTQAEVNTALARNQIVVVCVQVDKTRFVNFNGQGLLPSFSGPGNHCIHVDDLRFVNGAWQYMAVNNWGLNWANKGTAWATWSSFAQPIKNHAFYVLTSINDLAA